MRCYLLLECSVPKSSRSSETNEDASTFEPGQNYVWAAVADGTSEGAYSRLWARALVEQLNASERRRWCRNFPNRKQWFERFIDEAGQKFSKDLPEHRPWYIEASLERGVSATLAIARVDRKNHKLSLAAVGDCCIAYWFEGERPCSWPLQNSRAFHNAPATVTWMPFCSALNPPVELYVRNLDIHDSRSISIALMTDALALWFVRELENGGTPHERLLELAATQAVGLTSPRRSRRGLAKLAASPERACEHFTAWVRELRQRKQLRDDDTTLVLLRCDLDR
ncbi:MAG: protein phosphatase 2C domain-containing protein [Thermomicrobium sp.]|nr:protein phosphatase 2C domain-containing protein [Thermomicrobium sp.]MDW8007604.1 protein phosphatase 2C domain-containing protein [Thermomicrobium sp.]